MIRARYVTLLIVGALLLGILAQPAAIARHSGHDSDDDGSSLVGFLISLITDLGPDDKEKTKVKDMGDIDDDEDDKEETKLKDGKDNADKDNHEDRKGPRVTPAPAPSSAPSPTPSPVPPAPTRKPKLTPTITPTSTPTSTPTVTPTVTPTITLTPTPASTPVQNTTPTPISTPVPVPALTQEPPGLRAPYTPPLSISYRELNPPPLGSETGAAGDQGNSAGNRTAVKADTVLPDGALLDAVNLPGWKANVSAQPPAYASLDLPAGALILLTLACAAIVGYIAYSMIWKG